MTETAEEFAAAGGRKTSRNADENGTDPLGQFSDKSIYVSTLLGTSWFGSLLNPYCNRLILWGMKDYLISYQRIKLSKSVCTRTCLAVIGRTALHVAKTTIQGPIGSS